MTQDRADRADRADLTTNNPSQHITSSNDSISISTSLPHSLLFPYAAQPDIIRAQQKDAYYQSTLSDQISTVIRQYAGTRILQQYQDKINMISSFLYNSLTTLLGSQTLGEEYCEIIQVSSFYPLSLSRRMILISFHSLFPIIFSYYYSKLRTTLQSKTSKKHNSDSEPLTKFDLIKNRLIKSLPSYKILIGDYFRSIHLMLFYLFGKYYEISKRVLNVRYIFTRRLQEGEFRPGYQILGILLGIQLCIRGILNFRRKDETEENQENQDSNSDEKRKEIDLSFIQDEKSEKRKCTLCLNYWINPTVTDCGHVYCWNCIIEWCTGNRPECPLCRQFINISHLLPLYNY